MASRPVVRGLALASVLVMIVGALALFASGDGGVPSEGARITVDGRATLVRTDGATETLSTGDIVRAGEEVRAEAGSFVLELAGGGTLEGRAAFADAPNTRVVVGARPEVVAGDLLVQGPEGLDVDAAGNVVTLAVDDAAARVDRGLAVRTAAYGGGVAVDSAGQQRSVPALRQIGIGSLGRPPRGAEPFVFDETDPWDRRFLGGAISLDGDLRNLSTAFTNLAGIDTNAVDLVKRALPALAGEDLASPLATMRSPRSPGEVFIGSLLTALGDRGTFGERWDAVFGFRDEGAAWGLVALDQHLDESRVYDAAYAAFRRVSETPEVALSPPPTSAVPIGDGTTTTTGTRTGDSTPTTTTTTSPTPTEPVPLPTEPVPTPTVPVPTLPPEEEPVPDTGVPLVDNVLDPVGDLLGGLLGGGGSP